MFERHKDSGWLESAIYLWDSVSLQWGTTEENLGSIEFKDGIQVCLNLLIIPGEHWPNSQVFERSLGSLGLDLFKQVGSSPVAVHEDH